MTPAIAQLARHRLERAREALQDAEFLLTQGSLVSATNRFYYAAFYAARALLAIEEVDSSRHTGVIALFQKHFVKSGLFDSSTAKALARAFEKRQKSDYGDFAVLTREEVEVIRDETAAFVSESARLIDRLVANNQE